MRLFYNKYVVIISIIVLLTVFLYNIIVGNRGSYMDHSKMLLTETLKELQFPVNNKPRSPFKESRESNGEAECRRAAEKLTGRAFPKARPNFLKNIITGSNLELDCFCEELKIAIEYNGRQHYDYVPYFHSSRDVFYNTRYRDEMKHRLCVENGIRLIVVPYTISTEKIEYFIKNKFKELNII